MQLFTANSMREVVEDAQEAARMFTQFTHSMTVHDRETILTSLAIGWMHSINNASKSPHTIKNMISQARKEFAKLLDPSDLDLLKLYFKLDTANLGDVKAHELTRVADRAFQVIEYRSPNLYIEVASQFAVSDDVDQAKIGLMAVSGRRPSEMSKACFIAGKDGALIFDGQAKMRTRMVQAGGYEIPLLMDRSAFLDAMRKWGSRMLVRNANDLRRPMTEFAKQVGWPSKFIDCTPKALRGVYACLTFHKFAASNVQEWQWVNEVLGHDATDMATPQTYMRWRFEDDATDRKAS